MASLSHEQLLDLVAVTQRNLGPMAWTDAATELTDYPVFTSLMRKSDVKMYTGDGIQRNVMTDTSGAARHTGLFGKDNVNVDDVMAQIYVPFRHTETSYAFERREKGINGGPEQIVDLIKVRRADAMISLAELIEETFWGKPLNSSDTTTPWGVKYWMVSNATQGFNGGNPSGFTGGAGGLSSTTNTRWANWTDQYTAVSKLDLIKKMRKAHRRTDFKSPVDIPSYRGSTGQKYRIYLNEDTIAAMEDVGEAQNDSLGRDLAPMDGKMTFRSNPLIYTPQLDGDATNPLYMINWGCFEIFFLKGEHLRESKLQQAADAHNTYHQFVDTSWNTLCTNRRKQALITL